MRSIDPPNFDENDFGQEKNEKLKCDRELGRSMVYAVVAGLLLCVGVISGIRIAERIKKIEHRTKDKDTRHRHLIDSAEHEPDIRATFDGAKHSSVIWV
mmetsp:Transcript_33879/g.49711  ORF Transcript_33879/g.49711 Transcript_33879/m.49711 type:complete len:99 (-) Transcript_33879:86-382(-)